MNKTIIEPEKTERLRQLAGTLQMEIRGQRHIIPRVVSVLQRGELGLSKAGRPRGSFLFLGPTGVGKTELTQMPGHVPTHPMMDLVRRFDWPACFQVAKRRTPTEVGPWLNRPINQPWYLARIVRLSGNKPPDRTGAVPSYLKKTRKGASPQPCHHGSSMATDLARACRVHMR